MLVIVVVLVMIVTVEIVTVAEMVTVPLSCTVPVPVKVVVWLMVTDEPDTELMVEPLPTVITPAMVVVLVEVNVTVADVPIVIPPVSVAELLTVRVLPLATTTGVDEVTGMPIATTPVACKVPATVTEPEPVSDAPVCNARVLPDGTLMELVGVVVMTTPTVMVLPVAKFKPPLTITLPVPTIEAPAAS